MTFVRATDLDSLWPGEMIGLVIKNKKVLLANVDGQVVAYEDRCAHLGVELSRGTLCGSVLTCSAHQWQYDLCSGVGVNPASARLKRLPLEVTERGIFVDVDHD